MDGLLDWLECQFESTLNRDRAEHKVRCLQESRLSMADDLQLCR